MVNVFSSKCYCRDESTAGHSFTLKESIAVTSAEIHGATAYEVSGMVFSVYVLLGLLLESL